MARRGYATGRMTAGNSGVGTRYIVPSVTWAERMRRHQAIGAKTAVRK